MQSSVNRLKLVVILGLITLSTFFSLTFKTGASQAQRTEIAGISSPLSERLGADDKPSLVVHFTGEVHGTLEPCG
jgi:hypothetical protein